MPQDENEDSYWVIIWLQKAALLSEQILSVPISTTIHKMYLCSFEKSSTKQKPAESIQINAHFGVDKNKDTFSQISFSSLEEAAIILSYGTLLEWRREKCQDPGPDKLYRTLRWMTFRSSICAFLAVAQSDFSPRKKEVHDALSQWTIKSVFLKLHGCYTVHYAKYQDC